MAITDLDSYKKALEDKSEIPSFAPAVKTQYSRNITIEDWNGVVFNVGGLLSDVSATADYVTHLNIMPGTGKHAVQTFMENPILDFSHVNRYVTLGTFESGALGDFSSAIGPRATARGESSYARGNYVLADNVLAQAMGERCIATGIYSHAEGYETAATSRRAFAIGKATLASGPSAFAGGFESAATNDLAFAFGNRTKASGICSTAQGFHTVASVDYLHATGMNNAPNVDDVFEVGCGTDVAPKNALRVLRDGRVKIAGEPRDDNDAVRRKDIVGAVTLNTLNVENGSGAKSMQTKGIANASGTYSMACGNAAEATNTHAFAFGDHAQATASNAVAVGAYVINNNPNSVAVGNDYTAASGSLFSVGKGRATLLNVTESSVTSEKPFEAKAGAKIVGNSTLEGDFTVNGTLTVTKYNVIHATDLSTDAYTIGLAEGNTEPITTYIGLYATKYDGTNDGALVWDSTGTAYVGDVSVDADGKITDPDKTLQPLLTRPDSSELENGSLLAWNSDKSRAEASSKIEISESYLESVSANTVRRPYSDGNGEFSSMVNNARIDEKGSDYQYRMNFDGSGDQAYIDTHLSKTGSIYTAVTGADAAININLTGDKSLLYTELSGYSNIRLIANGDEDKQSLNYVYLSSDYKEEPNAGAPMLFLYNGGQTKNNQYGLAFDCSRNQLGYVTRDNAGKIQFNDVNYSSVTNLQNGNASYGYPIQVKLLADTFDFTGRNNASGITGNVTAGATGGWAVALGSRASASGENSYARGNYTIANATLSHAEGEDSVASGTMSHAEGYQTTASGSQSIALGNNTVSSGNNSIATGLFTSATHSQATAFGYATKATGDTSFAEGNATLASGNFSHAMGLGTEANSPYMLAVGAYNDPGTDLKVFEVGCGTGPEGKKNALSAYQDGSVRVFKAPANDYDIANKVYADTASASAVKAVFAATSSSTEVSE